MKSFSSQLLTGFDRIDTPIAYLLYNHSKKLDISKKFFFYSSYTITFKISISTKSIRISILIQLRFTNNRIDRTFSIFTTAQASRYDFALGKRAD